MNALERDVLRVPREDIRRIAKRVGQHYHPFDIRKGATSWRHIDNPSPFLKRLQTAIAKRLLQPLPLPSNMLGGVGRRTIADNSDIHARSSVLVSMDIRNFFPSTSHHQVMEVFLRDARCSEHIASLLTKLTTLHGGLPQGAPTSSALANLVVAPMFRELEVLARELDLVVSIWVDDIAFSGVRAKEAIEPAVRIVEKYGYSIGSKKTQVIPRHRPQRLTGTVVNSRRSVGQARLRAIRNEIYDYAASRKTTTIDLLRVQGLIGSVRVVSELQAARLANLAARLLPDRAACAGQKATRETRPCRQKRRHSDAKCIAG